MANVNTGPVDRKPEGVSWLQYAKKAFIAAGAGAVAVLGVLAVAITAGSDGGTTITAPEWIQAAVVALTAAFGSAGVFVATNTTGRAPGNRV